MTAAALAGVRVIDLTTTLSGPWCTHVLACLGADVIKLEKLDGGDDSRSVGPPFWNHASPIFLATNAGKRSLAVDLKSREGLALVMDLVAGADVFVQNFRPGVAERLGLGFNALRGRNDTIVYCNVGAFGHLGPRRREPGYDPLAQAATGIMSTTGIPGGPPLRTGASFVDHGAGLWAAIGVLAGLRIRDESGTAQLIDTSLYEAGINFLPYLIAGYLASGEVPGPIGRAQTVSVPSEVFVAADGDVMVAAGADGLFARLCRALGVPELVGDPRFATGADRVMHRESLSEILGNRFASGSVAHWVEHLVAAGVPVAPVLDISQVVMDAQFGALGMLQEVDDEDITDLRLVAPALSMNGKRLPLRSRPPRLGEHSRAILSEIGYDESTIEDLMRDRVIGEEQ